jgi:peptidoglycan/xylan/chitin deacetylase (PgdA/CDA1 family)
VYRKQNELYYYSIDQYLSERVLNEGLRRIGPGQITSTRWLENNALYYVRGSIVYRIAGSQFFARSLYQELLNVGTIVGKLPYDFDPNFDRYWLSPDGSKMLLSADGRSVNVLFLRADDYTSAGDTLSLPFLMLPRNTRVEEVLWSEEDIVTVMTAGARLGVDNADLYRLNLADPDERSRFQSVDDDEGLRGIAMAPDGTRAVSWSDSGVSVRRYNAWSEVRTVSHPELLEVRWLSNSELLLAGRRVTEVIDIRRSDDHPEFRTIVALSSVEEYGYTAETGAIAVRTGETYYELTFDGWEARDDEPEFRPATVSGDRFRVYLESVSSGSYENMVMVRNVETFGTEPLFPRPVRRFEPFPDEDEPVDLTNFSHGSRIRRREVALVFNAVDSVAGLTEILNTLAEYRIRATFFLNGDFIRRHPGAVRELAESDHEVGNLFYTYFDMSDERFRITGEFIKQGLARNEDEYFNATGRELALMWHAPYYFVSPTILSASREMNYAYIGRDVDSLDWVPERDETGLSRLYKPTARIIEDVIDEKRPGSIIAMTVGEPGSDRRDGGRADYLFHRLDVLIDGLIERGYEMVDVSTLRDNAR